MPAIGILERLVLLRVIDSLWVEHLTAVDDMRRGIGLRAYSQREPLNEFKIEAYRMFDELKSTIRHDVTHTIFRVIAPAAASTPSRGRWRATSPRVARPSRARSRSRPARRRRQRAGQRRRARAGARGTEDRPQRSLLVRLRQEVQALPRGLTGSDRSGRGGSSARPAGRAGGPAASPTDRIGTGRSAGSHSPTVTPERRGQIAQRPRSRTIVRGCLLSSGR